MTVQRSGDVSPRIEAAKEERLQLYQGLSDSVVCVSDRKSECKLRRLNLVLFRSDNDMYDHMNNSIYNFL